MDTPQVTSPAPLIYAAMVKIMRAIEAIEKTRKANAGQANYNFRGIDDVYNSLHDILADAGVFVLPSYTNREVVERETRNGAAMFYVTLTATFRFVAEDGSEVSCSAIGEGMDTGDKATNKAMSVALKYALMQTFLIPTVEPKDVEGDRHEIRPAGPQAREASAPTLATRLQAECAAAGITTAKDFAALCQRVIQKDRPNDDAERQRLIDAILEGQVKA